MSDTLPPRKPRGTARLIKSEPVEDPTEIARFEARFAGSFGNAYLVRQLMEELGDARYRDRRDLVGVIVGLLDQLTPEQANDLAAKLPAHLPAEAMAKLAHSGRAKPALDGGLPLPEPAAP